MEETSTNEQKLKPNNETVNETIKEDTNKSANEATNENINEATSESINEATSESTNETKNESTNENINKATTESANEAKNESTSENINEISNESTNQKDGELNNLESQTTTESQIHTSQDAQAFQENLLFSSTNTSNIPSTTISPLPRASEKIDFQSDSSSEPDPCIINDKNNDAIVSVPITEADDIATANRSIITEKLEESSKNQTIPQADNNGLVLQQAEVESNRNKVETQNKSNDASECTNDSEHSKSKEHTVFSNISEISSQIPISESKESSSPAKNTNLSPTKQNENSVTTVQGDTSEPKVPSPLKQSSNKRDLATFQAESEKTTDVSRQNKDNKPAQNKKVASSSGKKSGEDEDESTQREKSLAEFLVNIDRYSPIFPEALTDYYLSSSGFECEDSRIKKLLGLVTQKFVSDVATDAFQYNRIRSQGSKERKIGGKERKITLTMEDLTSTLSEYGLSIKKPEFFQ